MTTKTPIVRYAFSMPDPSKLVGSIQATPRPMDEIDEDSVPERGHSGLSKKLLGVALATSISHATIGHVQEPLAGYFFHGSSVLFTPPPYAGGPMDPPLPPSPKKSSGDPSFPPPEWEKSHNKFGRRAANSIRKTTYKTELVVGLVIGATMSVLSHMQEATSPDHQAAGVMAPSITPPNSLTQEAAHVQAAALSPSQVKPESQLQDALSPSPLERLISMIRQHQDALPADLKASATQLTLQTRPLKAIRVAIELSADAWQNKHSPFHAQAAQYSQLAIELAEASHVTHPLVVMAHKNAAFFLSHGLGGAVKDPEKASLHMQAVRALTINQRKIHVSG